MHKGDVYRVESTHSLRGDCFWGLGRGLFVVWLEKRGRYAVGYVLVADLGLSSSLACWAWRRLGWVRVVVFVSGVWVLQNLFIWYDASKAGH